MTISISETCNTINIVHVHRKSPFSGLIPHTDLEPWRKGEWIATLQHPCEEGDRTGQQNECPF